MSRLISNQELGELRFKRSRLNNLGPLTQLCMRTVVNKLAFFMQKDYPFKRLPRDVLLLLLQYFDSRGLLDNNVIASTFITRNSEVFKSYDYDGKEKKWIRLFYRLGIKSKGLKELHIPCNIPFGDLNYDSSDDDSDMESDYDDITDEEYYYGINCEAALHQMLGRLHNLQVISFTYNPDEDIFDDHANTFRLSDESLAVIAANCPLLRILRMGSAEKVTDTGINYLCAHGKCKNITELEMQSTRVTQTGVETAILNLPSLEILDCYSEKSCGNASLLNNVLVNVESLWFDEYYNETADWVEFYNIPKLSSLTFESCSIAPNSFNALIQHHALKLTHLRIRGELMGDKVDLSVVAYHCLNLESLHIETFVNKKKFQYELNEKHFTKLKKVVVSMEYDDSVIPIQVWKCLLSSPSLQVLHLSKLKIDKPHFDWLVNNARANHLLSNLETFVMCDVGYLSVLNNMMPFITMAPKLTKLQCVNYYEMVINLKKMLKKAGIVGLTVLP